MSKDKRVAFNERFNLQIIDNMPTLTCICGNNITINLKLLGKSDCLFRCQDCNELWHFERKISERKFLLIRPKTNQSISIEKVRGECIDNNEYYR